MSTTKYKHWSRNLEDVGKPIIWAAEEIEKLQAEKESLTARIAEIEYQIRKKDSEILEVVRMDWNPLEIEEAKLLK